MYANGMGSKSKEVTTETKELILKLYKEKERRPYISNLLDIPWSTIVLKKYQSTGTVEHWNGRRKLFIARDAVGLNRLVNKNRRASLHEITTKFNDDQQHSFSSKTIRRKLASEGCKRRAAKKCVIVCEVNRKTRVAWCRKRATGLLIRTVESMYILMTVG